MQCRKQFLLKTRKNYAAEMAEQKRQAQLEYRSEGLKNVSRNLMGESFDEDEKEAVDWVSEKLSWTLLSLMIIVRYLCISIEHV